MRGLTIRGALSAVAIFLLAGGAQAAAGAAAPGADHHIKTVFLILMENHNWTGDENSIKGAHHAPYINKVLIPMGSHANQYYNPPGNHPSLPNYIWLESGQSFDLLHDGMPKNNGIDSTAHLSTLLDKAGISWKAYLEDAPGDKCPLVNAGPTNASGNLSYAVRHEPFAYFNDVTDNQDHHSAHCIEHLRPFTELAADLQNDTVARYNFLTPNLCDDMHDGCKAGKVNNGDAWLATVVPQILNSKAYQDGGVIFVAFDEANTGDGPIPMIAISPFAKGKGYSNDLPYTHSSMLRTVQEIFGVTPLLGDAANAQDLSDLFTTFP